MTALQSLKVRQLNRQDVVLPMFSGHGRLPKSTPVKADPPAGLKAASGTLPTAEPEHRQDGPLDNRGWTRVAGVYRAPIQATQGIVELHLQWAPRGRLAWSGVSLEDTSTPASRKVRLAAIHCLPCGKSPRTNCEEYSPLVPIAPLRLRIFAFLRLIANMRSFNAMTPGRKDAKSMMSWFAFIAPSLPIRSCNDSPAA